MPMILNGRLPRKAFLFGRAAALQSTSDVVDQLQAQLAVSVLALLKELAEARAALDNKSMLLRLVATPCAPTVH